MSYDHVLNIESHLDHQVQYARTNINEFPLCYASLQPFTDTITSRATDNRNYYILDFVDFLDYATSDLVNEPDVKAITNNNIYMYDAIPNSYNSSILDTKLGKISIVGAVLTRTEDIIGIGIQFRIHERHEEIFAIHNLSNPQLSNVFRNPNFAFPYEFAYLTLGIDKTTGRLFEWHQCIIVPPVIFGINEYGVFYQGIYREDLSADFQSEMIERLKDYPVIFEVARLMIHLPSYFDFMYDIVLEEKLPVRQIFSESRTENKTRKEGKIQSSPPLIYRLVRSIRVRYEAEEEARVKLRALRSTWTAPAYMFMVSAHWRNLSKPWWKGRDAKGNLQIGKTWVKEFLKGKTKNIDNHQKVLKDPKVVIQLKQPLSYARDIIKSHNESKRKRADMSSHVTVSSGFPEVQHRKRPTEGDFKYASSPSIEWMYGERQKLTAGLRYLILRRDGFKCQTCGANGTETNVRLEVDHIIPISKWGRTEESNLRAVCRVCNRGKSDMNAV